MNVHLIPELERLVQRKVKSGRYNSASEKEFSGTQSTAEKIVERRRDLLVPA